MLLASINILIQKLNYCSQRQFKWFGLFTLSEKNDNYKCFLKIVIVVPIKFVMRNTNQCVNKICAYVSSALRFVTHWVRQSFCVLILKSYNLVLLFCRSILSVRTIIKKHQFLYLIALRQVGFTFYSFNLYTIDTTYSVYIHVLSISVELLPNFVILMSVSWCL